MSEAPNTDLLTPIFPAKPASHFANCFYIQTGNGLARIMFGEQHGDTPANYHTAVTVPEAIAIELATTLIRLTYKPDPLESGPA